MNSASPSPISGDLDGDGIVSPWEKHLCKLCLFGALVIAFGDKALSVI